MDIVACLEQHKASRALRKKQGYQNASQRAHASPHMHSMDCNPWQIQGLHGHRVDALLEQHCGITLNAQLELGKRLRSFVSLLCSMRVLLEFT